MAVSRRGCSDRATDGDSDHCCDAHRSAECAAYGGRYYHRSAEYGVVVVISM
jgi:hypothetical protein